MSSPADALRDLEERKFEQNALDESTELLKNKVIKATNPHPVLLMFLFSVVVLSMVLIYVIFVMPSASGTWVDDHGAVCQIHHGVFGGVSSTVGECIIRGNLVKFNKQIGIWDHGDTIRFLSGDKLRRVG